MFIQRKTLKKYTIKPKPSFLKDEIETIERGIVMFSRFNYLHKSIRSKKKYITQTNSL